MSESRALLVEMTQRLFGEQCDKALLDRSRAGEWPAALWGMLAESGLLAPATPEALGGAGADLGDAMAIFRIAGQAALPVPLVETALANWLLGVAGQQAETRPLALAPTGFGDRAALANGRLSLKLGAISTVGAPEKLVVVAESGEGPVLCVVATGDLALSPITTLAGDTRAACEAHDIAPRLVAKLPDNLDAAAALRLGAVARAMQMAGALERILTLTIQYAGERKQFGRPIAKFQAIQHSLAAMAGEAAVTAAMVQAAADRAPGDAWACAAAKLRAGEAATAATGLAHQIHGAMGFTNEHILHHLTRRLWAWRDEYGTEAEWAREIGRALLRPGAGPLWPRLAA